MSNERIKQEYPLHWFVWHNDFIELQNSLDLNRVSFTYFIAVLYVFIYKNCCTHMICIYKQSNFYFLT